MKKMLMVATVPSMIGQFNMNNLSILMGLGYEVHVACDFNDRSVWSGERINKFKKDMQNLNIPCHQIDFSRNPLNISKGLASYNQMKKLLKEKNFDFIHCHTPVAATISRIVAHQERIKVIYTAHGFHFYKGAPLKNWLIFYPIEKLLSHWTDVLITINKEDYQRASKHFCAKKVVYVPGVGIDLKRFTDISVDKAAKRKELGMPTDSILLLSVGELNENKNHETVIRALSMINDPQIFYIIAGIGYKKEQLENIISELDLKNNVHLIGYRNDINELLAAADIFVFPSYREGLSVALMEAMACGLPCAVSQIRGNVDLIDEGKGGILFDPQNAKYTANALNKILKNDLKNMGCYNCEKIKGFALEKVKNKMGKIYRDELG